MGLGMFGANVWPMYIGVTDGFPGEGPSAVGEPGGLDYRRGRIDWNVTDDGQVVGGATVFVPRGYYTHLAYFYHPSDALMVGYTKLSHPLDYMFTPRGKIDIYPIKNNRMNLLKRQGIDK